MLTPSTAKIFFLSKFSAPVLSPRPDTRNAANGAVIANAGHPETRVEVAYYFFLARTLAHRAFCAIEIRRLPAALIFRRGARLTFVFGPPPSSRST